MLLSLREETKGKLQMLLLLRKNGLTSLFKEVTVFKGLTLQPEIIAKLIPKTFVISQENNSKKMFTCNLLNHKRIREM